MLRLTFRFSGEQESAVECTAEITRGGRALRRQWLESLIRGAIHEGVYAKEVDPQGLANLIMSIFDGLRLSRLLWRDDFDLDGNDLIHGNLVEVDVQDAALHRIMLDLFDDHRARLRLFFAHKLLTPDHRQLK